MAAEIGVVGVIGAGQMAPGSPMSARWRAFPCGCWT